MLASGIGNLPRQALAARLAGAVRAAV